MENEQFQKQLMELPTKQQPNLIQNDREQNREKNPEQNREKDDIFLQTKKAIKKMHDWLQRVYQETRASSGGNLEKMSESEIKQVLLASIYAKHSADSNQKKQQWTAFSQYIQDVLQLKRYNQSKRLRSQKGKQSTQLRKERLIAKKENQQNRELQVNKKERQTQENRNDEKEKIDYKAENTSIYHQNSKKKEVEHKRDRYERKDAINGLKKIVQTVFQYLPWGSVFKTKSKHQQKMAEYGSYTEEQCQQLLPSRPSVVKTNKNKQQ